MEKILFLSHSTSLTGAPLLLHNIAALLDRSRYEPCFVVPDNGPLAEHFRALGTTIVAPLFPDELKYWRELKRIARRVNLLRTLRPDLVYCNTIHPAKWLVYARLLGIPTVTHVHELSMGFGSLSGIEHLLVRRFSDRFIAVSNAVMQYLIIEQHIHPGRISLVHAGINVEAFSSQSHNTRLKESLGIEGSLVIGTVGRITHMKGSDLFLQMAARLKSIVPSSPLKFLVIATTEDREFYRMFRLLCTSLHLDDDLVLIENVQNVKEYYPLMDVYVSTAREDPFPLVILEAMASRLPIVAFAVGGIPEAVTPDCGILVESSNLKAMKDAITTLVQNPERRAALGTAARARVEEHFNIVRNIKKFEEIIDAVLVK
ncbi:MAG: glycosyltransferase family 4 protein [Ignavibacteriae bacterium]|nr:glycosyltransferase family 4 protein [Ignavibacteria bacterium]MBI3364608.1 glycosyltransferase family 4 protein [Ignavibacteriota bacterium]